MDELNSSRLNRAGEKILNIQRKEMFRMIQEK